MSESLADRTSPDAQRAPSHVRYRKLIKTGLQMRLSMVFAGLTIVCLLLQWLLFSAFLTRAAARMPVGSEYLLDLIPSLLQHSILYSVLVAFPLTLAVGILETFRISGPVYRFESYLREVIRGTQLGPCKIRKGDALDELCSLINQATEPVRRRQVEALPRSEDEVA